MLPNQLGQFFTGERKWSSVAFIGVCIGLFLTLSFSPAIYIDEYWVASMAENSFGLGTIQNPALRNFSTNFIDAQPFNTFIAGLWIKTFGSSLTAIRFLSALCVICFASIGVNMVRKFNGKSVDRSFYLFVLFFITVPIIWRTGHINRSEPLVLFTVFLAMYANTMYSRSFIVNIGIGFISTLPVFFYITGIVIFPILAILWLFLWIRLSFDKQYLTTLSFRVIGIVLGGILFCLIVGTPQEVFLYFKESDISKVNIVERPLLHRFFSYGFYYFSYLVENILWYGPAWGIVILFFLVKGFRNRCGTTCFALFYIVVVTFFSVLAKKSDNYLVLVDAFFILLVISATINLLDNAWVKWSSRYLMTYNFMFIILYTLYFSDFSFQQNSDRIKAVIDDDSVVLARIQYKGFFFNNDSFLAFEDFSNSEKVNRGMAWGKYLRENDVGWIIWDDVAADEFQQSAFDVIEVQYKLVAEFSDPYLGHRIYEDIPYRWDVKSVIDRIRERPKSFVRIYKRIAP